MAAPNSVLTSLINSGTETRQATTSSSTLLTNPSSSNRLYKVDSLIATNLTNSAFDVSIFLVRTVTNAQLTSTPGTYTLLRTATLPGNTYISLISKDTQFHLTEGDRIDIQANANSSINVTTSYTIIG